MGFQKSNLSFRNDPDFRGMRLRAFSTRKITKVILWLYNSNTNVIHKYDHIKAL